MLIHHLGGKPTSSELQLLMTKMDSNNDGKITWEEFHSSLAEWLASDKSVDVEHNISINPNPLKRKAPLSPKHSRASIHKRMMTFFCGPTELPNSASLRNEFLRNTASRSNLSHLFADQLRLSSPGDEKALQLQLETTRRGLLQMHEIKLKLGTLGNDPSVVFECVQLLANVLAICDAFESPEERYEVAQDFTSVFLSIENAGVLGRILECSSYSQLPLLQYEALRVIAYFAPGPRIAHTPEESRFHPSNFLQNSILIQLGLFGILFDILKHSNVQEVKVQAVVVIGVLARDNWQVRDILFYAGFYDLLLAHLHDNTPLPLMEKITWAMAFFCGSSHAAIHGQPPSPSSSLQPDIKTVGSPLALAKLMYLLQRNVAGEDRLLVNVCTCLSYLVAGINDPNLIPRLMDLLHRPAPALQFVCLRIVKDLLDLGRLSVAYLEEINLARNLHSLLNSTNRVHDHNVHAICLELIAIIAADTKACLHIIQSGLVETISLKMLDDDTLRCRSAHILKLLCLSNEPAVVSLVTEHDILNKLAKGLLSFKTYDPVIKQIYNFKLPCFNFEYLFDLLSALEAVLSRGWIQALAVDMRAVVDYLIRMMATLSKHYTSELFQWQNAQANSSQSYGNLPDLVRTLAQVIRMKASTPDNSGLTTDEITELTKSLSMFNSALDAFWRAQEEKKFGGTSELAPVDITCVYQGSNYVIRVYPQLQSCSHLLNLVQLRYYSRALTMAFRDQDQDLVVIDTDAALAKAWACWKQTQNYKLVLTDGLCTLSSSSSSSSNK